VNVGDASGANPAMLAPEGIVTVPVKVGDAIGAFSPIAVVSVVDRFASFPSAVAISPRVSRVAPALLTSAATSART